jgi:hypothetical protein
MVHGHRAVWKSRCVSTPRITATSVVPVLSASIVVTFAAPFGVAVTVHNPRSSRERTIL